MKGDGENDDDEAYFGAARGGGDVADDGGEHRVGEPQRQQQNCLL
jgi:hypothetical protein